MLRRREFLAVAALAQPRSPVLIRLGGEPFTAFHYGEKWDKPFLHPLRAASGALVSRGYPLEPAEGEARDHPWHRGLWYGHGDINGEDFWRELGPEKTARIVAAGRPSLETRGARVRLTARLLLRARGGKDIGSLWEEFSFWQTGRVRFIEAVVTLIADRGAPLRMGDTEDGGFGIRLADAFREDRGARLLNSEGLEGSGRIWGKRARWVDYSAMVGAERIGVAMFDHPSNFRHPTGWHARGYSLCSANPFAAGDFAGDKSKAGNHTIPAGTRLALRYQVVIHPGSPEEAGIERLYRDFAR